MFCGGFNTDSQMRIQNIIDGIKNHPWYSGYEVNSYVYNRASYAVELRRNSRLINMFLFFSEKDGKISSIAIYGANLQGHLMAIRSTMSIFGMKVVSVGLDSGIADYVDVYIEKY